MSLISYPESISQMLSVQSRIFLGFIIAILLLQLVKRIINNPKFNRIKSIDLFPFFALITIPIMTLNVHGSSFLPLLVCIWMLIGVIWIIYNLVFTGELVIKRFLVVFWRFSDLYWMFVYIFCFLIKLIK